MKMKALVVVGAIMVLASVCMPFSPTHKTELIHKQCYPTGKLQLKLSTVSAPIEDPCNSSSDNGEKSADIFNPLGPPTLLANLSVGETYYEPALKKSITRVSKLPDIFLIRDFISANDCETLMDSALLQGMNIAGTKSSGVNTIRKGSHLTWIDPYDYDDGCNIKAKTIARETIAKSRHVFSHESMNDLMDVNVDMIEYSVAEDVQVAKYDTGGRYDYHHDGFGRYLTVLTYLNGIAGTCFPFGNMPYHKEIMQGIDFTNENEVSVTDFKRKVNGQCGTLIVGKEGSDAYLDSSLAVNPKDVIQIQAGDAVAFYNYDASGDRDLWALHCSLTVPKEKWISTCWFRSKALAGPFRSMKKARLLDDWVAGGGTATDTSHLQ